MIRFVKKNVGKFYLVLFCRLNFVLKLIDTDYWSGGGGSVARLEEFSSL